MCSGQEGYLIGLEFLYNKQNPKRPDPKTKISRREYHPFCFQCGTEIPKASRMDEKKKENRAHFSSDFPHQ